MICDTNTRPRDGETLGAWIDRVICGEEPGHRGRAERVAVAAEARERERRMRDWLAGGDRSVHVPAGR